MKIKKEYLLSLLLIILPLFLALTFSDRLPDFLDVHFTSGGSSNARLAKEVFIWLSPLLALGLQSMIYWSSTVKKIEISSFRTIERWMVPVLFSLLYSTILLKNLHQAFPLVQITSVLVGLTLIFVGNFLPKKVYESQDKVAPRWMAYGMLFFGVSFIVLGLLVKG